MSYRCLLVDDSERYLSAARNLLEREGVEVVATAGTPGAAITAAGRHAIDFSLIDVQLAAASGIALARELTERGLGGQIVLISALEPGDVADLVEEADAPPFVPKAELCLAAIEQRLRPTGGR